VTDPDELVRLAQEFVMRVREVDPERNRSWLLGLSEEARWELLFVLAATVDPDVSPSVMLGWTFPLADAAAAVVRERFGG